MYIYKIINNINGKIYVGQTTKDDPKYYGSGKLILKAITKYGVRNFTKVIIEECDSIDVLNAREIYWINYYNSRDLSIGYNLREGGRNSKHHDVSKEKIAKSLTGRVRPKSVVDKIRNAQKGVSRKPHSEEHKIKIGRAGLGRKHSKESKEKMSRNSKGKFTNFTEDHKENFKKSQKGVKWSEERKEKWLKSRIGITYKKPV